MALNKKQKQEVVDKLAKSLSESKSVVFVNYKGLTVDIMQDMRNQLREQDAELLVAKNTLIKLALDKSDLDVDIEQFTGPVAVAISRGDETSAARIIYSIGKDNEALEIRSGLLENEIIDVDKVKFLAILPTKDELIAKTVGTIKAPITGFVNVMAGNLRGLVGVLSAIKDTK